MKKQMIFTILFLFISSSMGFCQAVADYLILQDVGPYRLSKPQAFRSLAPVGGPKFSEDAGILSGTGHFPDHTDKTYEVMYLGGDTNVSPTVTITQHAGGDSDKWLMHEMEDIYREGDLDRLGLLSQGVFIMPAGNYKILSHGIGGGGYTWLSNNNVIVDIEYTSLVAGKPKPSEIVQAYIAKFPSIIPATFKLNSAHDIEWIKDEIDRRLWLCDKWVAQIQPEDAKLYDKLDSVVSSMNVFLDYREKYFGLASKNERLLLDNYLSAKNDASIRTKLTEYKTWWTAHKGDEITLP